MHFLSMYGSDHIYLIFQAHSQHPHIIFLVRRGETGVTGYGTPATCEEDTFKPAKIALTSGAETQTGAEMPINSESRRRSYV